MIGTARGSEAQGTGMLIDKKYMSLIVSVGRGIGQCSTTVLFEVCQAFRTPGQDLIKQS